eukprot:gene2501-3207_t
MYQYSSPRKQEVEIDHLFDSKQSNKRLKFIKKSIKKDFDGNISAIHSSKNFIYVGTSNGVIYKLKEKPDLECEEISKFKGEKKEIIDIQTDTVCELLFFQNSKGVIGILNLGSFTLNTTIKDIGKKFSKGYITFDKTFCFSLDKGNNFNETSQHQIAIHAGKKNNISIYQYGNEDGTLLSQVTLLYDLKIESTAKEIFLIDNLLSYFTTCYNLCSISKETEGKINFDNTKIQTSKSGSILYVQNRPGKQNSHIVYFQSDEFLDPNYFDDNEKKVSKYIESATDHYANKYSDMKFSTSPAMVSISFPFICGMIKNKKETKLEFKNVFNPRSTNPDLRNTLPSVRDPIDLLLPFKANHLIGSKSNFYFSVDNELYMIPLPTSEQVHSMFQKDRLIAASKKINQLKGAVAFDFSGPSNSFKSALASQIKLHKETMRERQASMGPSVFSNKKLPTIPQTQRNKIGSIVPTTKSPRNDIDSPTSQQPYVPLFKPNLMSELQNSIDKKRNQSVVLTPHKNGIDKPSVPMKKPPPPVPNKPKSPISNNGVLKKPPPPLPPTGDKPKKKPPALPPRKQSTSVSPAVEVTNNSSQVKIVAEKAIKKTISDHKTMPVQQTQQNIKDHKTMPIPISIENESKPFIKSRRGKMIATFTGENEEEISVPKDSIIDIIQDEEDGWTLCIYEEKEGIIPTHYYKETLSKTAQKRNDILEEFLETEETYVSNLNVLMKYFINPFLKDGIVSPQFHSKVFSSVSVVLGVNTVFLTKLKMVLKESDENKLSEMSKLLSSFAQTFKLYVGYIKDYESMNDSIIKEKSKNQKLSQYLLDIRKDLKAKGHIIDIQSYLILPVQRLPRYRMLLEDLLRNTPQEEGLENYEQIKKATKDISSIVLYCNEKQREIDDKRYITSLQKKFNLPLNRYQKMVREKKDKDKISFLYNSKTFEISFLIVLNDMMIFPVGKANIVFPLIDIKIVPALAKKKILFNSFLKMNQH